MPHVERTDYEHALRRWVALILPPSYGVTFAKAGGPRPASSYAVIQVTPLRNLGEGDLGVLDQVSGTKFAGRLQRQKEGTCSVSLYGIDARRQMDRLQDEMILPSVHESTIADGLVLIRSEDAIDLTELQGVGTVPRFDADFMFAWSTVTAYDADVIETVTVTKV